MLGAALRTIRTAVAVVAVVSTVVFAVATLASATVAQPEAVATGGCGRALASQSAQKVRVVRPGVVVQRFDKTDVTGGIAGLPDRLITDLSAGDSATICVGFHNRTGGTVNLDVVGVDMGASELGAPVPLADAPFGAGQWLHIPKVSDVPLRHGDLLWVDVDVDIPVDAAPGSAYAGVFGSIAPGKKKKADVSQASVTPGVIVQVFLDLPGSLKRGGEIVDVKAPRIVWWDGLHVGRIPVLDRMRGMGIAPIRFKWKNVGSVSDEIGGSVRIESSLGGKDVAKLPFEEKIVLRDSSRPFDATWSSDIPFIGRFTPTIQVTDSAGKVHEEKLPAIWVIPSWWYFIALGIAIGIPLWLRHRNKRRYAELLARVELAEANSELVDDWDEDSIT